MIKVAVLRTRKGVKGVGKKIAELFDGIDSQVVCDVRSKHRLQKGAVIINYGRSQWPVWWRDDLTIVNSPDAVAICCNKLKCLKALNKALVPTLDWTDNQGIANDWVRDGKRVFARTILNGKKGKGIVILSPGAPYVGAPLYTKEYAKKHEFRVFVGGGKVLDIVQKKKMSDEKLARMGIKRVDMDSRNYKKGWVFAHKDMNLGPKGAINAGKICVDALAACGLDYGAVDLLYKKHDDMVVCEINSAPEMRRSNTTWNAMKAYFLEVADGAGV
jgi:hypothetical protein